MLAWPSAPPESAVAPPVQAKVLSESPSAMLFPADPAVLAVIVTVAPLFDAVTTVDVAEVRLIAATKFAASVVVSVEVPKLVPEFVPSVPLRRVVPFQENPVKPSDRAMLLPADPAVEAVTVTVVLLALAVARVLAAAVVIAAAMLVASWLVVARAFPDQY